jgi:hypothetical protein
MTAPQAEGHRLVATDHERMRRREFVARSRAQQGLPPTVEDPATLDRIAAVFRLVTGLRAEEGEAA